MSPTEIREELQKVPFVPFRLVMSSGGYYDIADPLHVLVLTRNVHIGIPANPGDAIPDHIIRLDLLHVTELIPHQQSAKPQGNGQATG